MARVFLAVALMLAPFLALVFLGTRHIVSCNTAVQVHDVELIRAGRQSTMLAVFTYYIGDGYKSCMVPMVGPLLGRSESSLYRSELYIRFVNPHQCCLKRQGDYNTGVNMIIAAAGLFLSGIVVGIFTYNCACDTTAASRTDVSNINEVLALPTNVRGSRIEMTIADVACTNADVTCTNAHLRCNQQLHVGIDAHDRGIVLVVNP
jgi:hypothetical protein